MLVGIRERSVADPRLNGLGALESILPDKTKERGWFSKGLEAAGELAITAGTLGFIKPEFSGTDILPPIFGEQQPQGVRIGPGAFLGRASPLVPSVQFDLENRDVKLVGALPYLARQMITRGSDVSSPPPDPSPSIVSSPPPDPYANLSPEQAGHVLGLRDSGDYSKTQLYDQIINAPSIADQQILVQQSMGDPAANVAASSFLDKWRSVGGKVYPASTNNITQAGHALSLRDSESYTDQQRHAEITSAPPAQQTSLAQRSLDQADAAAGDSPTVICTELHRQGLIPEEWYKVDQKVGQKFWHSDPEVMIGYLSWGVPVAKLMAKSKVVTFLAKGLALKWAQEMYAQECKPELSTSAGRALCKYGPRICKFIGRRMSCLDLKEQ
jgi:hypothetical protein